MAKARKILKNLLEIGCTGDHRLLEERYALCEAAGKLVDSDILTLSMADLQDYTEVLKDNVSDVPFKYALSITKRHLIEKMESLPQLEEDDFAAKADEFSSAMIPLSSEAHPKFDLTDPVLAALMAEIADDATSMLADAEGSLEEETLKTYTENAVVKLQKQLEEFSASAVAVTTQPLTKSDHYGTNSQ